MGNLSDVWVPFQGLWINGEWIDWETWVSVLTLFNNEWGGKRG